jgi:hypothetical protein
MAHRFRLVAGLFLVLIVNHVVFSWQHANHKTRGLIIPNFGKGLFERRTVLPLLLLAPAFSPTLARADADPRVNRPRAPLEALVPASTQRVLLTKSLAIANQLADDPKKITNNGGNAPAQDDLQASLKNILEPPNEFEFQRPNNSLQLRYKSDQKAAKEKLERLSGRSIRASLNIYTANLRFGEAYVLTASSEERKRLIRNDQLPDVKAVITADLDLRDLYRNKIQTLVDDAQAELYSSNLDPEELQNLLKEASGALDKWFEFIYSQDVEDARKVADLSIIIELPEYIEF